MNDNILVTGATGGQGQASIHNMLKWVNPSQIVALVRCKQKAVERLPAGIEIREGNYDDEASLVAAMQGVNRVLLISGNEVGKIVEQHRRVIAVAKAAGVCHIAYTSRILKDIDKSANPLMEHHRKTEAFIKNSGLRYTIFQNGLYMETLRSFLTFPAVLENGIQLPAGQGKVSYTMRDELSEAIAKLTTQDDFPSGRVYQLTATDAWSLDDVASALSALSQKPVRYQNITQQQYQNIMREKGLSDDLSQRYYGFYCDIRDGQLDTVSPELGSILGRPPMSLKEGLHHLFSAWF